MTIDPVTSNLVDPFLYRLSRNIDLLVFNPPYVPTEDLEALDAQYRAGIASTWAGGASGMQITDVILDHLDVSAPRSSFVDLT